MPTVAELNQAAPQTPVLVLFAYSEVLINEAGSKRLGLTPASDAALDGAYKFVDGGAIVTGNIAVYAVIAKLLALAKFEDRVNSTENFLRELTRFGITSTVDAGESATAYPDDYKPLQLLATNSRLAVRISNFLFAQASGTERQFWEKSTKESTPGVNRAACRLGGYVLRGGGEVMVCKAHNYENFIAPRPDWDASVEENLTQVVRQLASHNWPIRMLATYDETITRILNVFERMFKETSIGIAGRSTMRRRSRRRTSLGSRRWEAESRSRTGSHSRARCSRALRRRGRCRRLPAAPNPRCRNPRRRRDRCHPADQL